MTNARTIENNSKKGEERKSEQNLKGLATRMYRYPLQPYSGNTGTHVTGEKGALA